MAAHGVFFALLIFLSMIHLGLPPSRGRPVKQPEVAMRPLSADMWAKNRGASAPSVEDGKSAAQREEKKKEKPPEKHPQGQVVDVAPGNKQEDPNAKYLAESANKAQKETKAKEQTAFYRNAMPRRTSTVASEGEGNDDKAQVGGNNGAGSDDRPLLQGEKRAAMEVPDVKKRSEVALRPTEETQGIGLDVENRTESSEVKGNSSRLRLQHGSAEGSTESSQGKIGQAGVLNLIPSHSVVDKVTGAAANDHLKDVEEGDGTYLSTKEWKYASFFNRVKQTVGQHWNPGAQLRLRDPTGGIYGGRDRYTLLQVTLNEQGRLTDVYVEKSCGVDFLDLEAVHSFERAQPFPNPPPGLLSDSSVRFQFGFFLEMGGSPRMRLFRSAN
jgi:TonB family protein